MGEKLSNKNGAGKSNWLEQLEKIQDSTTKNYYSVLPEEKNLKSLFQEGFVINKPKERVGGDGYWLHQHDEIIYLALFTCVGEGHLASMMIRIYMNALKKMVEGYSIDFPGSILQFLHQEVLARFKNKNNIILNTNANVGILKYNTKSKALDYAGANMDLIQVTDKGHSVIVGEEHQVGETNESRPSYSSISIKNAENSRFYLTSSGVLNLLGGPDYKKITKDQLGSFLHEKKDLDMSDQKFTVLDYLSRWTGVNKQNDDIMMIGIKA